MKESQEEEEEENSKYPDELDNEEEGGEWITPENVAKFIGGGDSLPLPE